VTVDNTPLEIAEVAQELGIPGVDGVLADLEFRACSLIKASGDFSFRRAAALDMRMDTANDGTADEIVNRWSEKEIADLLYRERRSTIPEGSPRRSTRATPTGYRALATTAGRGPKAMGKAETASRNKNVSGAADSGESERWRNSRQFLSRTPATLNSGGRWVVLSYHSREDRLVKHAFQEGERAGTAPRADKHVIQPSEQEMMATRVRESAKLRCGGKNAGCFRDRKGIVMARKKKARAMTEFHTVKRIDNSRIVRHVEPLKMRKLYRTAALGRGDRVFFMLYITNHFRCIDLSFSSRREGRQAEAGFAELVLELEIAGLRNPMRIDVMRAVQLGLTEPLRRRCRSMNPRRARRWPLYVTFGESRAVVFADAHG